MNSVLLQIIVTNNANDCLDCLFGSSSEVLGVIRLLPFSGFSKTVVCEKRGVLSLPTNNRYILY
jgi:hypothetical protein